MSNLRNVIGSDYDIFMDGIADMSFNMLKLQKVFLANVSNDTVRKILFDIKTINLYLKDMEYQIAEKYNSFLATSESLVNNSIAIPCRVKRVVIKGDASYELSANTLPALIVGYLNKAIDDGRFDRILECDSGKKCFYFVNKSDVLRIKELEEQRKEKQRAKSLSLKNDYIIYFWGSESACLSKILEWEYLFSDNVSVFMKRS